MPVNLQRIECQAMPDETIFVAIGPHGIKLSIDNACEFLTGLDDCITQAKEIANARIAAESETRQ